MDYKKLRLIGEPVNKKQRERLNSEETQVVLDAYKMNLIYIEEREYPDTKNPKTLHKKYYDAIALLRKVAPEQMLNEIEDYIQSDLLTKAKLVKGEDLQLKETLKELHLSDDVIKQIISRIKSDLKENSLFS